MKTKLIIYVSSAVLIVLVGTIIPVVIFTGEKEPPSLVKMEPYWNAVVSGVTEIHFEAIDKGEKPSGVRSYKIFVNDKLVSRTNSYSWDTSQYEDGSKHVILLKAKDKQGNTAEWVNTVVVDNTYNPPPSDAFKVMVHNIFVSGTQSPDWKDVLYEENADIMILSETGLYDDPNQMRRLTGHLSGYFFYEAPYSGNATEASAYTNGVAVISRYPIIAFHDIDEYELDDGSTHIYHRAWCDTVVDIQGIITHVISYHGKCCISAVTNNTLMRENEVQGIINYMDDIGDVPIMFGGDFNSNSPYDVGDVAGVADNLGDGSIRMLLIPDDPYYGNYSSKVHNFTDTWRTMYPHEKGWTYGFTDPQYWGRIDFLFVNQHWADKMINGTTGDTPSANFSSDHYSVDAFFSLDPEYSYNDTLIFKESTQTIKVQLVAKDPTTKCNHFERIAQSRIAIVNCGKGQKLRNF